MDHLIEKLNQAIDFEYDSKNDEIDELQLLPIEERVQKGDTIDNITAHFERYPIQFPNSGNDFAFDTVKIRCQSNISKFREGSSVVLSGHGRSFDLNIIEDKGEDMTLEVGWGHQNISSALNGRSGWRLDAAKVDIRDVVKKSTNILSGNAQKLREISGILSGSILPNVLEHKRYDALQIIEKTDLNDKQKEAFINAYSTDSYFLIQGPPGSGKTMVLAHLAKAFAEEGKKVLIAASTHTAINNALQKASILSDHIDVIKVGKKHQKENLNDNGSRAKNISDFSRSGYSNESKGLIVGATCYSPLTKKLEFMNWDVVIIDEAGQLGIPLAVAAMVKADKYIFIGDHKQLPPIVTDKNTDPAFSKSIFEYLLQFSEGTMLNVTYRMHSKINRFPSKYFYDNELTPHGTNANWLLNIDNEFEEFQKVLDINEPEVLVCHNEKSFSFRSEYEANLIAGYVNQYLKNGVEPNEIGIITPFRAQVRQIKKALTALNLEEDILDKIFVDTIEKIQGQERDIIMYSLATSNPEQAKQRANFFFNLNRLNVALTRSRKKRIVIANKGLFELHSGDTKLNELLNVFKAFHQDSYKIEDDVDVEYHF